MQFIWKKESFKIKESLFIGLITKANQESKASVSKANGDKSHHIHKNMKTIESLFTLIAIIV